MLLLLLSRSGGSDNFLVEAFAMMMLFCGDSGIPGFRIRSGFSIECLVCRYHIFVSQGSKQKRITATIQDLS